MGSSFVDEIDSGSNFFDQIDDLIKFPSDVEHLTGSGDCSDIPAIWNAPFPDTDDVFSGNNLLAELSVPYEDILQLEWLSNFVEDSFSSRGMTIGKDDNLCTKRDISVQQFQTSSPVSVLESTSTSSSRSSNCTSISTLSPPLSPNPSHQRARSKRPRPATFNPRTGIQLIPSFVETPRPVVIEKTENFEPHKKKNKIRAAEKLSSNTLSSPPEMIMKCMHCEITKTPQWRAGPMGPKTLCNACGVRYKSGRLFPEYRPAASPTFIPSLHSNSHKKVIQIRSKALDATTPTSTATASVKPI